MDQVAIRLDEAAIAALDSAAAAARPPVKRTAMARWLILTALGLTETPRTAARPEPAAPPPRPEPPPPVEHFRVPLEPLVRPQAPELDGVECPGCHWDTAECHDTHPDCVRRRSPW